MHDIQLTPDADMEGSSQHSKRWPGHHLIGDPTKTGEVVVQRLKLPPNYHVRRTSTPSPSMERSSAGVSGPAWAKRSRGRASC